MEKKGSSASLVDEFSTYANPRNTYTRYSSPFLGSVEHALHSISCNARAVRANHSLLLSSDINTGFLKNGMRMMCLNTIFVLFQ